MNKRIASFFLAATCTLGCRHVLPRAGPDAHVAASSPAATVTFQVEPVTKVPDRTPSFAPARIGFAEAQDADKQQARTQVKPQVGKCHPAASAQANEAGGVVARPVQGTAGPAGNDAHFDAGRRPRATVVDVKAIAPRDTCAASRPVAMTPNGMADREPLARPSEKSALPDHGAQGFSAQAWCCAASVLGAMFAYVLAPLIVEFMKHRMGLGHHQPAWSKLVQTEAEAPRRSGN